MIGTRVPPSLTCHSTLEGSELAVFELGALLNLRLDKAGKVETGRTCNRAGGTPRRKMEHRQ